MKIKISRNTRQLKVFHIGFGSMSMLLLRLTIGEVTHAPFTVVKRLYYRVKLLNRV